MDNYDTVNDDNDLEYELFGGDDFVFTQDSNKNIVGGGYKVESFFLQNQVPLMTTINGEQMGEAQMGEAQMGEAQMGGKHVSSPFENLAVPAGLFFISQRVPKHRESIEEHYKPHETASDDIMDKLFAMVEMDKKKKRKTRKHGVKPIKKHTRRSKS
jgi:hypothetical protein